MTPSLVEPVLELTQALKESKIETPKRKNVDFESALEETGFGRYNIYLIVTCGFLLFVANCESYSVGYVVPAAQCELNLDSYTKGILTSCSVVGVTASSTVWGFLSDVKGRRKLLILNLLLSFFSGVVAAVVPSFWGFVALRLVNGICIACPASISFVYLGEFLCAKTRAKSLACTLVFVALCLAYLPSLGWLLLQRTFTIDFLGLRLTNWRTFMLINSLPSILVSLALLKLPESPKYLYYSGRPNEALNVLKQMYASNKGHPEDSYPVESLDQKIYLERTRGGENSIWQDIYDQIVPLFKPPLLVYTFAACGIQAGILAISAGLYIWYPDIMNQVAKSGRGSVTICEALSSGFVKDEELHCDAVVEDSVFILNIIIGVYYLVAYAAWGVVVKMVGTRNFFVICMAVSAVSTSLLCFLSQKILIDIFFMTALTISGMSVAVLNSWIVEIFPTHIGGMALCTSMTIGRLGSVISSSITGIMLEWNCLTTFVLFALNLIVCLALSLLLPQKR